mmetsp:Transcript_31272/g.72770  ORF Transcript_31272/g.72770 Transcript_31272/m.72770 type:complete len:366 (-) Transcript_31272:218-1315(-)
MPTSTCAHSASGSSAYSARPASSILPATDCTAGPASASTAGSAAASRLPSSPSGPPLPSARAHSRTSVAQSRCSPKWIETGSCHTVMSSPRSLRGRTPPPSLTGVSSSVSSLDDEESPAPPLRVPAAAATAAAVPGSARTTRPIGVAPSEASHSSTSPSVARESAHATSDARTPVSTTPPTSPSPPAPEPAAAPSACATRAEEVEPVAMERWKAEIHARDSKTTCSAVRLACGSAPCVRPSSRENCRISWPARGSCANASAAARCRSERMSPASAAAAATLPIASTYSISRRMGEYRLCRNGARTHSTTRRGQGPPAAASRASRRAASSIGSRPSVASATTTEGAVKSCTENESAVSSAVPAPRT